MHANDIKLHQTASRVGELVLAARCTCGALALLGLLLASGWMSATALSGLGRRPDDVDGAVAVLAAGLAAVVLLVWTCGAAVTALALAARAAGRASRSLDALSAALTPVLLRRVLAATLGVAALGGVAGPALAVPAAAPSVQEPPALTWPAAPGTTPPPRGADPVASPAEVVVRRGDTLWGVAARALPAGAGAQEVAAAWPRWYSANRAVIGSDPDLLLPGQRLVAPEAGS